MPEPGICGMCSASHASRSVWRGSWSTPRARPSRPSGPRNVVSVAPSCSATSLTTRSLAVAVQPSTGTDAATELADEPSDPPVVGAEVVTPVGDAVHLVDHDEAGLAAEHRHDRRGELGVGQPFGRHEHEVDVVRLQPLGQLVDGRVGRRVDGHAAQPEPAGGEDLVAHQRQQRRDQQRRPEPLLAQDAGGHEVHRALAPPGPLHDEHPLAPHAQRLDRLPLPVAEVGGRVARQRPQRVEQRIARRLLGIVDRRGLRHGSSMTAGSDDPCPVRSGSVPARTGFGRGLSPREQGVAVRPGRERLSSVVGVSSGARRRRW